MLCSSGSFRRRAATGALVAIDVCSERWIGIGRNREWLLLITPHITSSFTSSLTPFGSPSSRETVFGDVVSSHLYYDQSMAFTKLAEHVTPHEQDRTEAVCVATIRSWLVAGRHPRAASREVFSPTVKESFCL